MAVLKRITLYILAMFAAVILFPLLITSIFPSAYESKPQSAPSTTKTTPGTFNSVTDFKTTENIDTIRLLTHENKIITLSIEEYVKGVVAAEMPVNFGIEALKAQAVVSRTFAIAHMNINYHNGADVCDNYLHCQQWIPFDRSKSGADVIEKAVNDTANIIICYMDEPINAFFHSNSCGRTENVEDVWDFEPVPYLKSVESPGETNNPDYYRTVEMSLDEMLRRLATGNPYISALSFGGEYSNIQFTPLEYTAGGRVKTLSVNNINFKGTEVRSLLGIKSANFKILIKDGGDIVLITTEGSGHGVGLSQWGAKYMNDVGINYRDILKHYYKSVDIKSFK